MSTLTAWTFWILAAAAVLILGDIAQSLTEIAEQCK